MESFCGVKANITKPWCLMRDFNKTIFPSNIKAGLLVHACYMEVFGDCINACDLLELSLMGKKFIWSKGNSASHIDFSSEWLKKFPSSFLCGFF